MCDRIRVKSAIQGWYSGSSWRLAFAVLAYKNTVFLAVMGLPEVPYTLFLQTRRSLIKHGRVQSIGCRHGNHSSGFVPSW